MTYRQEKPYVTWFLVLLTVGIYILETLNGGSTNTNTLLSMGAKATPYIQQGEIWRLVTPIFLHIGILHILMNMLTLYYIGQYLEPIMGHVRFFILYMVSGIVGNLASFAFGGYNQLSAGASTSLFGTFAAFVALAVIFRENRFFSELGKSFLALIIFNLLLSVVASNFDIWGHIGGMIGGFFLGIGLGLPKIKRPKLLLRVLSLLFVIIISYFMYTRGMAIG